MKERIVLYEVVNVFDKFEGCARGGKCTLYDAQKEWQF